MTSPASDEALLSGHREHRATAVAEGTRSGRAAGIRAVIVCPTEYGGQIEHAADTAMALASDPRVESVVLLSRPGADDYLGRPAFGGLTVIETLPPRRTGPGTALRRLQQCLDLVREHLQVRALARTAGTGAVIALDSSKYPFPGVLRRRRGQSVVLFLHNVEPHHRASSAELRERLLRRFEMGAARGADRVIVHGHDQLRTARRNLGGMRGELIAVPLPMTSRIDEVATRPSAGVAVDATAEPGGAPGDETGLVLPATPYALVIGELRANKGVELAIDAAALSGVPMLVAGRAESAVLAQLLQRRAAQAPAVRLEDRFLERAEFQRALEGAAVVVLPYLHFDAQSGIVAKSVAAGRPIVASGLPSLREQIGDHSPASFVDVNDPKEFARVLRGAFDDAVRGSRPSPSRAPSGHADWRATVEAVIASHPEPFPAQP